MTPPIKPEPLTGPVRTGTPPTQAQAPRQVSPFYYRYLTDQATAIRARGGSDEDVKQFVDAERDTPLFKLAPLDPNAEPPDVPSNLRGVSMALVQGATFGFGDEAFGALLGTLTGVGAREGIEEYRAEYESWAKDNGKKRLVAELAGGLASGGVFAGLGAGAAGMTLGRTMAIGALSGAAAGAGNAEGGISERTKGALLGATLGAAGGAVASGLGAVIKPIARPIAQKVLPNAIQDLVGITPEARARELLARTLASEGLTPTAIAQRAAELQAQGIPATILEVGGDAVLRLAADAAKTRSPLKTKLLEELLGRQAEQGERLTAGLIARAVKRNRFGTANAYDVEDALHAASLTESEPLYKQAYQQVVSITPRMQKLLEHPRIREAYRLGAKLAADEDFAGTSHGLGVTPLVPHTPLFNGMIAKGTNREKAIATAKLLGENIEPPTELAVRGLDYMKRGLDIIIDRGLKSDKPTMDRQGAKALLKLRDEIIDEARTQIPAYDQALTTYAGHAQAKDAVKLGMEFLRRSPGEVAREMRKLTPNERDFYRVGAVQALYERVFAGQSNDAAKAYFGGKLFGGRSLQAERIRALFPGAPDAAESFMRQVAGEARISYSTGRVAKFPSAGIAERAEQATEGSILPARGSASLVALSAARSGLQRLRGQLSEEVSDELTHLFGKGLTNPAELTALVQDLFGTYAKQASKGAVKVRAVSALAQKAGQAGAAETR